MRAIKVSTKNTYIILCITVMSIGICIVLNRSLLWAFFVSIIFSLFMFVRIGFSFNELKHMVIKGVKECKNLYILILLIGATVSIWLSSGVVPTMMYYGFEYMKGMNFLFATFIITSSISVFMGTAVGTISTIGVALLGIGKGFGLPTHVLLGSIISGAFIADKISPISGLLNLTLSTTRRSYKETIKCMLVTLVPAYFITGCIYYFIGRNYGLTGSTSNLEAYKLAIHSGYFITPFLLILPIMVVGMSVMGVKIIKCIFMGLVGGIIFSIGLQHISLSHLFHIILFGYKASTSSYELNKILISGGVFSMLEVVLIVMGAIILNSIFEGTSLTKPLIDKVIKGVKSKGELILKTGIISSVLTIVTCDQTVGIILPAKMIKNKYNEMKIEQTILARTISDTGTIIAPLMPWNVNGLIIYAISGISAVYYAPYAILCYICPIISILMSYEFKIGIKKPVEN